jgi:energy-coupling factor transporter ATP-binding protein EcfA2
MTKPKIIAFCGAKGSGKSTSAELLKEVSNLEIKEVAFADHLKLTCSKVFNLNMDNFINPNLKERELDSYINLNSVNIIEVLTEFKILDIDYDRMVRPHMGQVFDTPRKLLQYIGTNLLHLIDPLIHVKSAFDSIDSTKLNLITDLRFPQEFEALKDTALLVYVSNDRAELLSSYDTHASEKGFLKFRDNCIKLDNNQDVHALREKIQQLVKEYL